MNKRIQLLAVLLGAQLLLALGLGFTGRDFSAPASDAPLLAVQRDKVDRLIIEGPDQTKVVLSKVDGAWRLPESGDFPADGPRVDRLLSRLSQLPQGPAVATSEGAPARFRVNDETFERRVTLAAGDDTLATLYLGTSPGVREVHARAGHQKAVYTVEFGTYELPVKAEDWEDKAVLQFPKDDIEAIEVAGLRLSRLEEPAEADHPEEAPSFATAENTWRAETLEAGEILKTEAVDTLARLLAGLRIGRVLAPEGQADPALDEPAITLSLRRSGGQTVDYHLAKSADEGEYILKTSTRPEYFRLPPYIAEPLMEAAKRDALLEVQPAMSDSSPEGDETAG